MNWLPRMDSHHFKTDSLMLVALVLLGNKLVAVLFRPVMLSTSLPRKAYHPILNNRADSNGHYPLVYVAGLEPTT